MLKYQSGKIKWFIYKILQFNTLALQCTTYPYIIHFFVWISTVRSSVAAHTMKALQQSSVFSRTQLLLSMSSKDIENGSSSVQSWFFRIRNADRESNQVNMEGILKCTLLDRKNYFIAMIGIVVITDPWLSLLLN